MKGIVLAGGAGFIGSNFIYFQLKNHPEDRIVCLDALTYAGNLKTLDKAMQSESFRFVKGDTADRDAVYRLFEEKKSDIVVNSAAESHVDRSVLNPEVSCVQTSWHAGAYGRVPQVLCKALSAGFAAGIAGRCRGNPPAV